MDELIDWQAGRQNYEAEDSHAQGRIELNFPHPTLQSFSFFLFTASYDGPKWPTFFQSTRPKFSREEKSDKIINLHVCVNAGRKCWKKILYRKTPTLAWPVQEVEICYFSAMLLSG